MHFLSVIYVTICNIFLAICVAINLYFFSFLLRATEFRSKCILVYSLLFELA